MNYKEITHNKLVRDNIPEIICSNGDEPIYKVLSEVEYFTYLNEKIKSSLKSNKIEELADIMEVIYAILAYYGISFTDFEKIRTNKSQERGNFSKRIFLEKVIEKQGN